MAEELSRWEKARILMSGFATPVTVALVGLLVSSYLNRQQTIDTNTRAFAELINRREEADTNLRKEMFTTVLGSFFESPGSSVDDRILKLEILAYNFHQSLDLGPVFQDLLRKIDQKTDAGRQQFERLRKVAKDVVYKQVEGLKTDVGASQVADVYFEELQDNPVGLMVIDRILRLRPASPEDSVGYLDRRFQVEVLSRDLDRRELRVRLVASAPGKTDLAADPPEVDVQFTLGFFDFPGINNTRLSNSERCAVVLQLMDDLHAQVLLVMFPANRAGLKDSMYVEEFVREMLRIRRGG